MLDRRIPLKAGTILEVDTYHVSILEEVGRGGSCLVYNSMKIDRLGVAHRVRLKELYPFAQPMQRSETGCFVEEAFSNERAQFLHAYKQNVSIRNTLGLSNSTTNPSDYFEANHTVYALISFDEGIDARRHHEANLYLVLQHIQTLGKLILRYHEQGYLHLDIKPENILILPETPEHIMLFDFDSILKESELRQGVARRISFSDGFSAPELMRASLAKIGKAMDIFSIGAVLFYKLFGKKPTVFDCAKTAVFPYEDSEYFDAQYSPRFFRLLTQLLHQCLSSLKLCPLPDCAEHLHLLRRQGWIEYETKTEQMGQSAEAIACLVEALKHDKERIAQGCTGNQYSGFLCYQLIDLLLDVERREEALAYAQELTAYSERWYWEDTTETRPLLWMVAGHYQCYRLETDPRCKKHHWNEAVICFDKIGEEQELPSALMAFLRVLADCADTPQAQFDLALDLFHRTDPAEDTQAHRAFLDNLLQKAIKLSPAIQAKSFFLYAEYLLDNVLDACTEAQVYLERAWSLLEAGALQEDYQVSLLARTYAKCLQETEADDKEKIARVKQRCHFFLLAERESAGKPTQEVMEHFLESAEQYQDISDETGEKRCLQAVFQCFYAETEEARRALFPSCAQVWGRALSRFAQIAKEDTATMVEDFLRYCLLAYCDTGDVPVQWRLKHELETLAHSLWHSTQSTRAIQMYAFLLLLTEEVEAQALLSYLQETEALQKAVVSCLYGESTEEKIDQVVSLQGAILPMILGNEDYLYLQQALEDFSAKQQYGDIAFQR